MVDPRLSALRRKCRRPVLLPACALLVLCPILADAAEPDTVAIHAAAALKGPINELAAALERRSGQRVVPVFDTAGAAEEKFLAGDRTGILISSAARIDDAERRGALSDGVKSTLGDTVAGFAMTPGLPRPPLATVEQLKSTLLAARRIAFSDPARGATVGAHFMRVIAQLGVRDAVMAKAVLARDGIETMRLVLSGDADLGITQISEIVQSDPAALAGPFPPEFDLATTYVLWHRKNASAAVSAFAAEVVAAEGRAVLQRHGLRAP